MDDVVEEKLIAEAEKAKSQWKAPKIEAVAKAIFLSDHYSWTWQPSRYTICGKLNAKYLINFILIFIASYLLEYVTGS